MEIEGLKEIEGHKISYVKNILIYWPTYFRTLKLPTYLPTYFHISHAFLLIIWAFKKVLLYIVNWLDIEHRWNWAWAERHILTVKSYQ